MVFSFFNQLRVNEKMLLASKVINGTTFLNTVLKSYVSLLNKLHRKNYQNALPVMEMLLVISAREDI